VSHSPAQRAVSRRGNRPSLEYRCYTAALVGGLVISRKPGAGWRGGVGRGGGGEGEP